jgi:hydrogenase nickel incorporation protein HypA/HybF
MHEWALVDSVIRAAVSAAEKERLLTVDEVVLVVGELQSIVPDVMITIFDGLKKESSAKIGAARLVVETEAALFKCRACQMVFGLSNLDDTEKEAVHFLPEAVHVYTKCPGCKSPDFELQQGRGVYIKEIRGEQ